MGAVMGRYMGREMACIAMNFGDFTRVAPMVEGGFALHADVTEWKPWPRVAFPLPMGDAAVAFAAAI
jgi:hypothetical protein